MSHLQFNAQLSEVLKMDGDLSQGPIPRWQRKANEQGITTLSIGNENSLSRSSSLNVSSRSPRSAKTPHSGSFLDSISPRRGKSPGRTIPKLSARPAGQRTPGRKTPTTPHNASDRFIPNRSTTELDRSHHLLIGNMKNCNNKSDSNTEDNDQSIQQKDYTEKMAENLNNGVPPETRILSFKAKVMEPREGYLNKLKVIYCAGQSSTSKATSTRHIPNVPEKVLDAPELLDDYYLHLVDWSVNNHLAVALGSAIYIWNAGDGSITALTQFEDPDYVSCLSWIKEGNVLGVGLSNMTTQLWDVSQQKCLRTMGGHEGRVASLSWKSHVLSAGSRSGQIINHDVRTADHISARLSNHTQEVCGLKWSPDGRYLASGGNDNLVNIWDSSTNTPLHSLTQHQAAVKGLAWCPWQQNILATGGGTADRTIKLWNCSNGVCMKDVTTNSQVSSLVWSSTYKELISGHGYSQYQLSIWKYPTFNKVADLTGHTGRVLELCLSPDGQTVVSAAADETIRLWKCWAIDKKEKKQGNKDHPVTMLSRSTIR